MPLDFNLKPDSDRPVMRPPNYSSAGTRLRLFGLVAVVLFVVMMASKIRDPDFWQFMGWQERGIAGGPPLTKGEIANRKVDTELHLPPNREGGELANSLILGSEDKPQLPTKNKGKPATDENGDPAAEPFSDPTQRAWLDGWSAVIAKLTQEERSLIFKGLKFARDGKSLGEDDRKSWSQLVESMNKEWLAYHEHARKSLEAVPEAERPMWSKLVEQLSLTWNAVIEPALRQIAGGEKLSAEQLTALNLAQEVLDHVALATVEDSTLLRATETESWFRFFEQLQNVEADDFRKRSQGIVGFLQLYDQPKLYRGKIVTVRGTARVAYYVPAPKNMCEIAGYYVFWVFPAGGPDSPFVIYSLEKPASFPPIKKQSQNLNDNQLHEDVEFTGFSFKRWAYSSRGGIHMAPLMLAKAPRWEPSPEDLREPPNATMVLLIVTGCGIGAVLFAVYAFRHSLHVVKPGSSFSRGFKEGSSK